MVVGLPVPAPSSKSRPRTAIQQSGSLTRWATPADVSSASTQRPRRSAYQPRDRRLTPTGLAERVELRQEDGGAYLARLADESVDLLFLDAERVEYPNWWPHPARVLRRGGVLVIDNVQSHADEVASFLKLLDRDFVGTTVAVGKGLHLASRLAERRT